MSKPPFNVSVVIPCHNQGDTLVRAVQSAINAQAFEVIIVNDASTDSTPEIIRFNGEDPTGTVFVTSTDEPFPVGVSAARNWGISAANSHWILPLDADDELLPGAFDALLTSRANDQAAYGDYVVNDALMKNADPGMIYRKSVCHATVLFSKADWQRVGGYKPEFNVGCEDWEFMLSLVEAGVKLVHVDAPIYRKAMTPDGRGAKCFARKNLIASLLKEYHPKVQL